MDSQSNSEMFKLDLEDLNNLISLSKRPNIKRQLEEYKRNLEFLLAEEEKKAAKEKETKKPEAEKVEEKKPEFSASALNFQSITKYALDTTNNTYVKIYITDGFANLKTHDANSIKSKFTKNTFDVYILNWQKKNFRFSCFNLAKDIIPENSYTKATSSGLIIYLAKANKTDFWDNLEKKKSLIGGEPGDAKNKNKDPNESLMDMMRDMYQNGDPEMKRMIAEAWTKSRDEQAGKMPHAHDHPHDHSHDSPYEIHY